MTKLLVALAMLLSIASGPAFASGYGCGENVKCAAKQMGCQMACCAAKEKQPAQETPAPVGQRVGQEVAAAVMTAPFSVLFRLEPTEARRAPRALFADGHAPEPLAASCIRLI